MCGDPPNVIIGTSLGYTFGDFIQNTGLIVAISLIIIVMYFVFISRREFVSRTIDYEALSDELDPKAAITDRRVFRLKPWHGRLHWVPI